MKNNPDNKKILKRSGSVQSLNRALAILDAFPVIGPDVGLTKIAEYLGLNKATAYRLLVTLEYAGFLERSPNSRKYRLGVRLFELGAFYQNQINIRHIALPFLSSLMGETQETAFLCIREGDEALCVELIEAKQEVKVFALRIGGRQPLHTGAAPRVLITQLDSHEIEAYAKRTGLPAFTPHSITTIEDLIADIEHTRKNGYTISLEDVTPGIAAIGAPIRDYSGKIIASISISGMISNFNDKRIKDLVNSVITTAKIASRHMGYTL